MYKFILTSFIYFFLVTLSFAQDNFAEAFINFPRNIHLYIPSNACIDNDIQSDIIYKTYIGKLSVIKTFYADLNFNLSKKGQGQAGRYKHILGLGFYNDKEGEYFSKIRVLSRYGVHLPVRKDMFFAAGVAVHVINYSLQASGAGAAGSDLTWSGNISLTLYNPTFKIGLSYNDFNNPEIRPINYDFNIPRYVIGYGEKVFSLNENTQLMGSSKIIWKKEFSNSYLVQGGFIFSKIVSISTFISINKGWGLVFDLNKINILKSSMDFSASYFVPRPNAAINVIQYELNLRYNLKKKG